jgi:hypothetical protein
VSKCCFASNSGATSALAGSPGFTNPPLALQRITDAGDRSLIPILSDINMHNAPNPHAGANVGKIVEKLELELMDRLDRQRIFAQHPGSLSGRNLARRPFQANQRNPRTGVGRSYSLFAAAARGVSIFAQTAGSSWAKARRLARRQ